MKHSIQILQKTVVQEYYRQNIGFLFLIFLFAGSFLRANEHIALGKLAVSIPTVLAAYSLIWGLYSIKTYAFTLRLLNEQHFSFLYNLVLLPNHKRLLAIALMQLNVLALNIGYSIFVLYLALIEKQWWAIFSIILFNSLVIFVGVFLFDSKLKRQNFAQNTSKILPQFSIKFKTIYPFFFIRYLLNKQPILLFLSKIGASLLLIGIAKLYPTDDYDERLFSIGALFVAAINIFIGLVHFMFENQYFRISKNMPISSPKRLINYSITLFCLLIPEFLALFRYLPKDVSTQVYAQTCLLIFSLNFLIISILYINFPQERLLTRVFYGGVLVFLLIMFKVPILLISFANFAVGFMVFHKNYYLSEPINS